MRMRTSSCGDDRALNNSRVEQQSRVLYYMSSAIGEEKEKNRMKNTGRAQFYLLLVQTNDAHTVDTLLENMLGLFPGTHT